MGFLTDKMGPLPVWAWGGIIGTGGYVLLKRMSSQAPSSTAQQIPVIAGLPNDGSGGTTPIDTTGGNIPIQFPPELPPLNPPVTPPASSTGASNGQMSNIPPCIDAQPGQYCIEHFFNQGGNMYVGESQPYIGLVPAQSAWWNNLSTNLGNEISYSYLQAARGNSPNSPAPRAY